MKVSFLDLKLHDIPETVARAMRQAAQLGAELITVHAGGGRRMLGAAATATAGTAARVLAVTVLTSMVDDDLADIGAVGPVAELVLKRAALAASAYNRDGHLVAHFQQQAFADLLVAHCPRAEAMVSADTAMLVRAAQDPGSSRVHHDLLSVMTGSALFSLKIPDNAALTTYGELMSDYKLRHNATVVAVADDARGNGLSLNAPASKHVGPGQVVYYIAERRIS